MKATLTILAIIIAIPYFWDLNWIKSKNSIDFAKELFYHFCLIIFIALSLINLYG